LRIAFREWRVAYDTKLEVPVLFSSMLNFPWEDKVVEADHEPEEETGPLKYGKLHGIHACLPGANSSAFLMSPKYYPWPLRLFVMGAVDVQGKVVEHTDGVVRAERVEILALRVMLYLDDRERMNARGCDLTPWLLGPQMAKDVITQDETGQIWTRRTGEFEHYRQLVRGCRVDQGEDCYGCPYIGGYEAAEEYNKVKLLPSEMEEGLLLRYGVPRLPDNAGPWRYDEF
jgi:hypothetical protein